MNPNLIVSAIVGALSTFAAVAAWFEPEPKRGYACETSHAAAMATTDAQPPAAAQPAAPTAAALAQQQCAPHPEALARVLADRFGERVSAYGVDAVGSLVQVYAAEAGNWTIAVTRPDGVTCIVSAGEAWTIIAPGPGV